MCRLAGKCVQDREGWLQGHGRKTSTELSCQIHRQEDPVPALPELPRTDSAEQGTRYPTLPNTRTTTNFTQSSEMLHPFTPTALTYIDENSLHDKVITSF